MRLKALLPLVLLVAACGGSDEPTTTTTGSAGGPAETTVTTAAAPGLDQVALKLTEVGRFDEPLAMTWCPGDPTAYVAEKGGRVRTLEGATILDLSADVSSGNEQGLLGLACGVDGAHLYASYTDRDGNTAIEEFPFAAGPVDRSQGRIILGVGQPAANHNGGNIVFGPDDKLWLGLGDGGGGNDTYDNGQQAGEPLGSMVRLDPADGEPEIVIKGLRNPWRFSFDRETQDLWIGDVGQNAVEEIDVLAPDQIEGANLGWPAFEGTRPNRDDVEAPGAIPPVFEYGRGEGQSVAGGYVYRGQAIAGLQGAYLFADTYAGELRAIVVEGGKAIGSRTFLDVPGGLVSSFAEGPDAELYVLSLDGGVFRLDPA